MLSLTPVNKLKDSDMPVGAHGDDHGPCGCGACAQCLAIFEHIAEDLRDIAKLAEGLGVPVTPENQEIVVDNARHTLENGFFVPERSDTLVTARESGAKYEELAGPHGELFLGINTIPGTTISRERIREEFGPGYDLFVADAWSLSNVANVPGFNNTGYSEEADRITQAGVVYNLATASQLGHESLPIVSVSTNP